MYEINKSVYIGSFNIRLKNYLETQNCFMELKQKVSNTIINFIVVQRIYCDINEDNEEEGDICIKVFSWNYGYYTYSSLLKLKKKILLITKNYELLFCDFDRYILDSYKFPGIYTQIKN